MDNFSYLNVVPLSPDCFWGKFAPPTIQFCENNLCEIITQPANTWSNLAYIFIGAYLLFWRNQNDKEARITGWIAILIGISSFFYHASFTFLMQYFDLSSMFLYSSFILTSNLCRVGFINVANRIKFMIIIVMLSMLLLFLFRKSGIPVFGLQIIAALLVEYYVKKNSKFTVKYNFLFWALLFFSFAFGIWLLDLFKIFCYGDNHYLQGHAIWHILSAFSILFIHKFYLQNNSTTISTDVRDK